MIKLTRARHLRDFVVELEFSDATMGEYDFAPLAARDAPLAIALRDEAVFKAFFLELGALCWPHGLELSAASLHRRLEQLGGLRPHSKAVGQN
jgi:hypothetical protein